MAGLLKVEKQKIELNLTTIKQLTQQISSFGLENAGDPIFQWRLVDTADNLKATCKFSDLFPMNNCNFTGQLHLTFSDDCHFKLYFHILDRKKQDEVKTTTLNRFQLFLCHFKLRYRSGTVLSDKCFFAIHVINVHANKHAFTFPFPHCFEATTITVELYHEPLALIEYRSPIKNTVVGKMERVKEMMEKTNHKGFLFVSPRFDFGVPDQLMMVRFRCTKYPVMSDLIGLTASLHIFSQSRAVRGAPFSFTVTFVIFSQTENVKDCINKVFCRRGENKSDYDALLLFSHELEPYLENDTLYYKVHIESQPIE